MPIEKQPAKPHTHRDRGAVGAEERKEREREGEGQCGYIRLKHKQVFGKTRA